MKNTTKIALSNLFSAAGSLLIALTAEFGDDKPQDTAAAPEAPKPVKPKKEKPAAAAPAEDKPAEPAPETPAEPEQKPAAPEISNPKYEEHRALIAPLVQGADSTAELRQQVKDLIKKYDPDNTPHSLKTMPTKNHANFERDIAALGY